MQTTEKQTEKMLLHQRIQTILLGIIVILLLIGLIFLLTQFQTINDCLTMIETDLQSLDMNVVNDAVENISKVAGDLHDLDFNAIDSGIGALTEAANNLGKIDIGSINQLVSSIQSTASKLESVAGTLSRITSIFG